jgi:hypothetical protein
LTAARSAHKAPRTPARSAHKALQDAFAYLIVLKHKARAGDFDCELANDFDGHEEVWTSIRDLIQAHLVEAFASKTKTLQCIELRRRIIVCEGDRLIYTHFLSREFSDEERQILTDVMFTHIHRARAAARHSVQRFSSDRRHHFAISLAWGRPSVFVPKKGVIFGSSVSPVAGRYDINLFSTKGAASLGAAVLAEVTR